MLLPGGAGDSMVLWKHGASVCEWNDTVICHSSCEEGKSALKLHGNRGIPKSWSVSLVLCEIVNS